MRTIIPALLFILSLTMMGCLSQFGAGLKASTDRTAAILQTVLPTESPNTGIIPQATPTAKSTQNDSTGTTADWTLYELPDEGFSIRLPEDWRSFDMEETNFAEALNVIGSQNEGIKQIFTDDYFQSLIASGIKFYALNVTNASLLSDTPASINIIRQDLPVAFTIDEYATLASGQLARLFDLTSDVQQDFITLDDHDAVKLSYTASLVGPFGTPMDIANTQYIIIDDTIIYIVTMGVTVDLLDEYQAQFHDVAETFRLHK